MVWESSFAKTDKRCHVCRKNFTVDEVYFSALAMVNCAEPIKPATTPALGQAESELSPLGGEPPRTGVRGSGKSPRKTAKTNKSPVVKEEADHFTRKDYCNPCWENTGSMDKDMFSFWQMRLVLKEQPKTPKDILLSFFDNMVSGQNLVQGCSPQESSDIPTPPDIRRDNLAIRHFVPTATNEILQKQEMRPKVIYLFALILIRKRLLKLKQTAVKDGQRLLILERSTTPVMDVNPRAGRSYDPAEAGGGLTSTEPVVIVRMLERSELQPTIPGSNSLRSNCQSKVYEIPDIDIPQEELISLRDEFSRLFEFRI